MSTKKYKIIKTDTFTLELDNIISYIFFNLKEPNIAKRKYKKINQKIHTLEQSPERCPLVHGCKGNIRKLIVNNYIVIYETKKDTRANIYITYFSFKTKLFK